MQVFETPGSVSLQIKLPSDGVVVAADEFQGRHTVRIEQKALRWGPIQVTWGDEVEVRVTCPPGTDLELSGAKTQVRATGELGEVSIRSVSGDVHLDSARRRLEAKTASGNISVTEIADEATIVTVSGDIDVRRVTGSLEGRAVSGDIEVGVLDGPLALSTTSGDVVVRTVEAGEVRVQTVSGDVRLGVGRGTRVWIDAGSVSGDLRSELGIADEEPASDEYRTVVPLHVKTVSGDVSVVRAAERVTA